MRTISIEKVTLNIGVGESGERVERAKELLEMISGTKAVKTKSNKRIPTWNLRPGLEIGVKVTLRGKKAVETLKRLFKGVDDQIKKSNFDKLGNLSFGVPEYISVPDAEYDPKIGIIGFDVAVTMQRPGYKVKKIGKKHRITTEESINFFKKKFGVDIE